MEYWSGGVLVSENHYSNTPSLQLTLGAHLRHERLRIHDHAEVLVEIGERRLLFLPSERCIAVRQEQDFEIPHGTVARRAVAADVGRHSGDRDRIAAESAQQVLQLRAVKATVTKLLTTRSPSAGFTGS